MWVLFYLILAVEAWRSQVIQHKACVVEALTPIVIGQLKAFHSRSFNEQCLFTFPLLFLSICYIFFLTLLSPRCGWFKEKKIRSWNFFLTFVMGLLNWGSDDFFPSEAFYVQVNQIQNYSVVSCLKDLLADWLQLSWLYLTLSQEVMMLLPFKIVHTLFILSV